MKHEPSPAQPLDIRCPTCGAAPGEMCELIGGQPRNEPHRDRKLIASDKESEGDGEEKDPATFDKLIVQLNDLIERKTSDWNPIPHPSHPK